MERIRSLDRCQKIILLSLLVMAVVFAVVYGTVISREGYLYLDTILVPTQADAATVYSGKIDGAESSFTVAADTVTFVRGDQIYGPYLLREDPTAIPEGHEYAQYMTGLEILEGQEVFFRGGLLSGTGTAILYHENGEVTHGISVTASMGDGTVVDLNGNPVDIYAPSVWTILDLIGGPELTHKGHWLFFLMGLLFSGSIAVSILFADDLFRFRMSFRVQNAYDIEPSDWEIASRYIGWILMSILILFLYFAGLR